MDGGIQKAVRLRHTHVEVRPYKDGRFGYDDYWTIPGKRKRVRLRSERKAKKCALDLAVAIENGQRDFLSISPAELAEFSAWKERKSNSPTLGSVISELMAAKCEDKNLDPGYISGLKCNLSHFDKIAETRISEIETSTLSAILARLGREPRTRNNIRDALCHLFRFARERKYLPDEITAAEKVKRLKLPRSTEITIYTAEDMRARLDECRSEYIPGETIPAFAGIREEEVRPKSKSHKDPLRWEDFNWEEDYINVRDETSKTGIARHVPFLPVLKAWLEPWRNASGPVMPHDVLWERKRIEKKTGIPRLRNARRHSFGTYRMSLIQNIHQLAEEMGNSIDICRSRYVRPRARALAQQWFNLLPGKAAPSNIIALEKVPKSAKKTMPKGVIRASR